MTLSQEEEEKFFKNQLKINSLLKKLIGIIDSKPEEVIISRNQFLRPKAYDCISKPSKGKVSNIKETVQKYPRLLQQKTKNLTNLCKLKNQTTPMEKKSDSMLFQNIISHKLNINDYFARRKSCNVSDNFSFQSKAKLEKHSNIKNTHLGHKCMKS